MKILHILYSGLGGHGNVFFSMVDADRQKEFTYEGLFFGIEDVREGYVEKARARNIPWYFVKKKPGYDQASYKKIREIVQSSRPDVLFIHSSAYIFPAKRAARASDKKIKVIVRETQPNHLKTKAEWIGLCFALLAADQVVFLSKEYRDDVKKRLSLFFSEKRTTVIPNGIDLSVFRPMPSKDDAVIRIGMQSRLSGTKDHATLIKAFQRLVQTNNSGKEMQLYIAGDGECREALERSARELGIAGQVFFLGMLEETALPAFINSLHIYVHATLGETMSTAIMQVMACRMPIIASDVAGVNNMVRHEQNGLLVPPQNETAIADAVSYLLNHPAETEAMAQNAYDLAVSHFSNELMFSRYRALFLQ